MTARTRTVLAALALSLLLAPAAAARSAPGVQHLHFRFGPIRVTPGTNVISAAPNYQKPAVDGYITSFTPNLRRPNGSIPRVDVIHLHHGVWLDDQAPVGYAPLGLRIRPIFAAGEEKTKMVLPPGYGLPYRASDQWIMNYMIHNLTNRPDTVYITYDLDFIPRRSPAARRIKPVRPVWMDVQAGHAYPVFDVLRGSGRNGAFTYPDQALDPYHGGPVLDQWSVDRPGTLVATAGHLHPGGLYDDLELVRPGARVARARRGRPGPIAGGVPHSVRLFRSRARYFDRRGPISWDLAMTATPRNWRVRVRRGDVLRVSATYESRRAAWYEAMGIMVVFMADDASGVDPFRRAVPTTGAVTHGHLHENDHHGGTLPALPDARSLPDGAAPGNVVKIGNFRYLEGDLAAAGAARNPPTVAPGHSLTFVNGDASANIFHSITACQAPCSLTTGISFPLANGAGAFDSGQLGFGPPGFTAAANRDRWQTPSSLAPGTYTFFCRVHPFMRGAFRVR